MKTTVKNVTEIINGSECPLPLEVIPNYMGINLCSVESVEWIALDDGQLDSLTIKFIPEGKTMEEVNVFTNPMTEEERKENIGKPLKTPVRFHLVDCLKDLKYGRPVENQKQIDKWISEIFENLESGAPFS